MTRNDDFIAFEWSWGKKCERCKDYDRLMNEYSALKGFIVGFMQSNGVRNTQKYANEKIIDIKLLKNDLKLIGKR